MNVEERIKTVPNDFTKPNGFPSSKTPSAILTSVPDAVMIVISPAPMYFEARKLHTTPNAYNAPLNRKFGQRVANGGNIKPLYKAKIDTIIERVN